LNINILHIYQIQSPTWKLWT